MPCRLFPYQRLGRSRKSFGAHMQQSTIPLTRDLVLIGGGHTHALFLHKWAMAPLPGVRVTVINPAPTAPYTGMLPGHIAGHYPRAALEIDLVKLGRRSGARVILGKATGIDRVQKLIHLPGRPPLPYDVASVDIGITSDLPMIPGYLAHGVSAKPLGQYAQVWAQFMARVAAGHARPEVVVIGAGVAGVELAMAMAHRMRATPSATVTLLEATANALPGVGGAAQKRLLAHVRQAGISLRLNAQAREVSADHVVLADGDILPAGLILGAAGSRPQDWLRGTGLHLTDGYITVDATLQSITDPDLFAVGDCAHMRLTPRPKAGVYAVRQAPVLYENLRAAFGVGTMRQYHPQRDYLKLISLGDRSAIADKWGLPLQGKWLWRIKDSIDEKFMAQFRDARSMAQSLPSDIAAGVLEEIQDGKPMCGGCGAKMGADALRSALATLPPPKRTDLVQGAGDDAAILQIGGQMQVLATDHLRPFTDDLYLMAQIAATHALGDVWAMGAVPQIALVSVTLPRMSPAMQTRSLSEILAGAASVFGQAGADIAGGHTSLGAELSIGFTVTGLVNKTAIAKSGALPGDALVLTKPIGTGTILAAEMALADCGDAVAAAFASMVRPSGSASAILAPVARAMTDVTGFGLAGHLLEILVTSGVGAEVTLGDIPLLPGAEELAAAGHASSLAPVNWAAVAPYLAAPDTARTKLLIDPQTAGGMLAAVPQSALADTLAALRDAGDMAVVIGHIIAGPAQIKAR
jgi:selenide,water dikinase